MRVAILHYHFQRGGVTKVVEATLRALAEDQSDHQIALFSGGDPTNEALPGVHHVPGLGYSDSSPNDPATLLDRFQNTVTEVLGAPPDLWHIHNPTLGKNGAFPDLISGIAARGDRILLHLHDFAEDGRPQNYRFRSAHASNPDHIFPLGHGIHYAVLNRRDHRFLTSAGLPTEQCHLLANPVECPSEPPLATGIHPPLEFLQGRHLQLYPVRALRRKNLGELLLLAALSPAGSLFATSLGPTNPAFQSTWEKWQAFTSSRKLPVLLGLNQSGSYPFLQLVEAARAIVTTSIAEGFGLGFLEPWISSKPVWGRDLPEITTDFLETGVRLPNLYHSLPIPHSWLDLPALYQRFSIAFSKLAEAYCLPSHALCDASGWSQWLGEETIDFGKLDEIAQMEVIDQIIAEKVEPPQSLRQTLIQPLPDSQLIAHNRSVIAASFSPQNYCSRLLLIWEKILADPPPAKLEWIPTQRLLRAFLNPSHLSLLQI
ncbi:MAG: glycosyltransferase [Puniceicoccaceae bacterium]